MRIVLAPLIALLPLFALPAAAQTVRGELVDQQAAAPVAGAQVRLLDASGRVVASALTDEGGGFTLRAPSGGSYSLRVERVGYAVTRSPALVLSAGEELPYRLVANPEQVLLAGIVAQAERRCVVRPGTGERAALVWEEARKALDAARSAAAGGRYRYRVEMFERDLEPRDLHVRNERLRVEEGFAAAPFVPAEADRLTQAGFIEARGDTVRYHAPDAQVLLSDRFLDGYCFRTHLDREHPGQVGLAFEPARGAGDGGIRGVLWLDAETAELRTLDYEYTRPPLRHGRGVPGGRLEFRRLPNGVWVTTRWWIRMPVGQAGGEQDNPLVPRSRRQQVAAVREQGGRIVGAFTREGAAVPMEPGATLTGVVYDSTRAAPFAGGRVRLAGTAREAVTDESGRYVLHDVSEGSYSLTLSGPRLDSLGYVAPPVPVTITRASTHRQDLAVPSMQRVLAQRCPPGGAVLAGFVRDVASGRGVPGARVVFTVESGPDAGKSAAADADSAGVYRLCALPEGVGGSLTALAEGMAPAGTQVPPLAANNQRDLALSAASVVVAAVEAASRPGGADGGSDLIGEQEIRRHGAATAYDLVQSLHPEWLRPYGLQSLREANRGEIGEGATGVGGMIIGDPQVIVYQDDVRLGPVAELLQVPTSAIVGVRYYTAAAATRRWGSGHNHGVIQVLTVLR